MACRNVGPSSRCEAVVAPCIVSVSSGDCGGKTAREISTASADGAEVSGCPVVRDVLVVGVAGSASRDGGVAAGDVVVEAAADCAENETIDFVEFSAADNARIACCVVSVPACDC